jgi:Zn-dependent protease with chaperone function
MRSLNLRKMLALLVLGLLPACLAAMPASAKEALEFKPGFNLFSHNQDIQLGREASTEVEKEVSLVKDSEVTRYVSDLGMRLTKFAPGDTDYPWSFKVVDSQDINAFALPGGFIYINRGVLEAADNEAEVAGVIAHEIGHVVMRHGTHQASQAMLAQMPLAIFGGILGQSTSIGAQLAQLGIGLGLNSILLKNSRGAESQADQIGTYTLYQAGYNPHAMADFFEIIQKKYPQRTIEFFSDHPNPENRIARVDALIPELGPARDWKTDSREFQLAKAEVLKMPPPPKAKPAATASAAAPVAPPGPSNRLVKYQGKDFAMARPDNWKVQESQGGVILAPEGGIVTEAGGNSAQAYGASVSRFVPSSRRVSLRQATQQIIDSLRNSNPNLRIVRQTAGRVQGRAAYSTMLENDSPLQGQKETDRLVTVSGRDGVLVLVFIAPQSAYESYRPTFEQMLKSLEVR